MPTTQKFTPGPWRVYVTRHGVPCIEAANGRKIATMNARPIGKSEAFTPNHELALSSAYLLAASQDLLAACVEAREVCAAAMRVLANAGRTDEFLDEVRLAGIPDGFGTRIQAAIDRAVRP